MKTTFGLSLNINISSLIFLFYLFLFDFQVPILNTSIIKSSEDKYFNNRHVHDMSLNRNLLVNVSNLKGKCINLF